jgi:hypothetical protein
MKKFYYFIFSNAMLAFNLTSRTIEQKDHRWRYKTESLFFLLTILQLQYQKKKRKKLVRIRY